MEKRAVFFTMVMHPATGWTRVGNAYPSRKSELMENINSAAKDCPHCKGAGVVFDGHF